MPAIEAAKSLSRAGIRSRLRGAQHDPARDLRERHAVVERGIDEAPEVIERIVGGMIDAIVSFAVESQVHGIDAQVLQERRVVGPRTERAELQVAVWLPWADSGRAPIRNSRRVFRPAARASTLAPVSGSFTSRAASLKKCCKA